MALRPTLVPWLVLLLVAAGSRPAAATGMCSPEIPAAQFTSHPDSLPAFAAGQLGALQPGFARAYLVVAYLYLSGGKLDAATQRGVVAAWLERNHAAPAATSTPVDVWLAARRKIVGAPPPPKLEVYDFDAVCLPDAFLTAARTAARLATTAGVDLAAWAQAQDQVFANCTSKVPSVPSELPPAAPAAARAERDYQIAAACLYLGDHAQAALRFGRIAADKSSPWAPWGDYLAARAQLRRSLFGGDPRGLDGARPLLERLAADASDPERARRARALLDIVSFRREPGPELRRVAAALHRDGPDYLRDLDDYLLGLDLLLKDGRDSTQIAIAAAELPGLVAADDMTDWAIAFQGRTPDLEHALARWDERKTPAWLLVALSQLTLEHPRARELIAAAGKLQRGAPAYDSATFQVLRLLGSSTKAGDREALGRLVEGELRARAADPPSTLLNQLLDLRLAASTSIGDAVAVAERYNLGGEDCGFPAAAASLPAPRAQAPGFFAPPFARVLERHAPLARVVALLDDPALPAALRPALVSMAHARALLLGEADPALRARAAVLDPSDASLPEAAEDRELAIALRLLAKHDLDPQSLDRGELWCPVAHDDASDWKASVDDARRLLPADELAAGAAERDALEKLGGGLAVIVRWTLAYGEHHPDDPRLPQVLYDINRTSRYVHCNATEWSKKAYLFMHKAYPKHPLTKKVQYWY